MLLSSYFLLEPDKPTPYRSLLDPAYEQAHQPPYPSSGWPVTRSKVARGFHMP